MLISVLNIPMFYKFSNAIVRLPSLTVVNGLSEGGKTPDYEVLSLEHKQYVETLRKLDLKIHLLKKEENFPDSVFVEDPALTFDSGAILLRLGAPSRRGEQNLLRSQLSAIFETVLEMKEGSAEGGDILRLNDEVMIGLSKRTNEQGARELNNLLFSLGLKSRIVDTPKGVLHFKSDCCALDEETIFATRRLVSSGVFKNYNIILTPNDELPAANSLRVNDTILIPAGYPKTADLLSKHYEVELLSIGEVAKIDAGLSCMSLRW